MNDILNRKDVNALVTSFYAKIKKIAMFCRILKHIKVDKHLHYTMSPNHFGRWLLLWSETIDELFKGELAQRAKTASQNMAMGQFLVVYRHRTA